MPTTTVNGIDLYYETYGDPAGEPMLLVCGLGMQLVSWSSEWIDTLVADGYFVIAYDNRDAGLSTHLESAGVPDFGAFASGGLVEAPYLLADMADDAAGLVAALGIGSAHVVGVSMGGMIVQQLVIDHPNVVRSLCSIMSTTGDTSVGQPTPEAIAALLAPAPTSRSEAEDQVVAAHEVWGSPGFPFDEERERAMAREAYDRSNDPGGFARQGAAIVLSPDRTAGLHSVRVPTVVVHGLDDTLVQPSGGEATAAAVPGARLVTIEGMGHSMPMGAWPIIIGAIRDNTKAAAAAPSAAPAPAPSPAGS